MGYLVLLVAALAGAVICYRSPDPPGMRAPSTPGQRLLVSVIAGAPAGAAVGVLVLFIIAMVTGRPVFA